MNLYQDNFSVENKIRTIAEQLFLVFFFGNEYEELCLFYLSLTPEFSSDNQVGTVSVAFSQGILREPVVGVYDMGASIPILKTDIANKGLY